MSTITKKELVDRIAESTQAKRVLVKATVQNFLNDPKTLEQIHVSGKRVVKFKAGRLMRQKLNSRNAKV